MRFSVGGYESRSCAERRRESRETELRRWTAFVTLGGMAERSERAFGWESEMSYRAQSVDCLGYAAWRRASL